MNDKELVDKINKCADLFMDGKVEEVNEIIGKPLSVCALSDYHIHQEIRPITRHDVIVALTDVFAETQECEFETLELLGGGTEIFIR